MSPHARFPLAMLRRPVHGLITDMTAIFATVSSGGITLFATFISHGVRAFVVIRMWLISVSTLGSYDVITIIFRWHHVYYSRQFIIKFKPIIGKHANYAIFLIAMVNIIVLNIIRD